MKSGKSIGYFFLTGKIDKKERKKKDNLDKDQAEKKDIHSLTCTVKFPDSKKMLDLVKQFEPYATEIKVLLKNVNHIEAKIIVENTSDFFNRLANLILILQNKGYRELTQPTIKPFVSEDKSHTENPLIKKIFDDQRAAFNDAISKNQSKKEKRKHYKTLVQLNNTELELIEFAKEKELKYVSLCQDNKISDKKEVAPQSQTTVKVERFDILQLEQKHYENFLIHQPENTLITLAIGGLESTHSLISLLIKLRLLGMNLLLSIYNDHTSTVKLMSDYYNQPKAPTSKEEMGTIMHVEAGSFAITFNREYIQNLISAFYFKTFLVKSTDQLLVFYNISDKLKIAKAITQQPPKKKEHKYKDESQNSSRLYSKKVSKKSPASSATPVAQLNS